MECDVLNDYSHGRVCSKLTTHIGGDVLLKLTTHMEEVADVFHKLQHLWCLS